VGARELLGQCALSTQEDGPGRRLEGIARLVGEEIPSQDEDLALGSGSVLPQCRLARPDQCLE
jgi:hypothetical protein